MLLGRIARPRAISSFTNSGVMGLPIKAPRHHLHGAVHEDFRQFVHGVVVHG